MPHQNYKSSAPESELRQVIKDNDIAVKGARGLGLKHKQNFTSTSPMRRNNMDRGLRARKSSLRIYLSLMHIMFPNKIALFLIIKKFNLCFKESPNL